VVSMMMDRWTPLRKHGEQQRWIGSQKRFNVVPAGRRSGKTEIAKRKIVLAAMEGTGFADPRFFAAAPTRDQAKRIFWADLKAMVPKQFLAKRPSETELMIPLVNGASIWVVGMDKPERIEGPPWDGGVLDEYGNVKAQAWGENVRPALSDRVGWCDLIGVPEGRNHYYDLFQRAKADEADGSGDWGAFHWISADILPPEEIEAAKRDLDELTFQQEYEASFVNFVGRAYYPFNDIDHCGKLEYNPRAPLAFCFDFNVAPGVAAVCQEKEWGTAVIGEVWIPQNSNTPAVCRRLHEDWGEHRGPIVCYGDATGGARGSAKVEGSDWDLVKRHMKTLFHGRVTYNVPSHNPSERARVNAVNSRLKTMDGTIRLKVDRSGAPHVVRDLEGVRILMGGSGEIDKKKDLELTHISDALGYYIEREFPIRSRTIEQVRLKVR